MNQIDSQLRRKEDKKKKKMKSKLMYLYKGNKQRPMIEERDKKRMID